MAKWHPQGLILFYLFYATIHPHYDVLNKEKLQGFYNLKMEYTLKLSPTAIYIKSVQLSMETKRHINKIRNMTFVTSLSLIQFSFLKKSSQGITKICRYISFYTKMHTNISVCKLLIITNSKFLLASSD